MTVSEIARIAAGIDAGAHYFTQVESYRRVRIAPAELKAMFTDGQDDAETRAAG